jgi:hypothetical protein
VSWRSVWAWIDEDFNSVRPWSVGIYGLALCAALIVCRYLGATYAEGVIIVVGCAFLFAVILPYYVYRSVKNIARVSNNSWKTITGNNRSDSNDG